MGLGDWEDTIPGIFIVIAILGLIGAIAPTVSVIKTVPVLGVLSQGVHKLVFLALAGLFTPYIPLSKELAGVIIELITIIGGIIFIVKVKVL